MLSKAELFTKGREKVPASIKAKLAEIRASHPGFKIGIFHIHTNVLGDDGVLTPQQVVEQAEDAGIDEVALTGHDTDRSYQFAYEHVQRKGFKVRVTRAIEVTTNRMGAHLIALGIDGSIRSGRTIEDTQKEVKTRGGVLIVPHMGSMFVPSLSERKLLEMEEKGIGPDAIETEVAWVDRFSILSRTKETLRRISHRVAAKRVVGADAHGESIFEGITLIPQDLTIQQAIEVGQTVGIVTGIVGKMTLAENIRFAKLCAQETAVYAKYRAEDKIKEFAEQVMWSAIRSSFR